MPHGTGYIYDDIFLEHELEPLHPESPLRLAALHAAIAESGLLQKLVRIAPLTNKNAITEATAAVHTRKHIENVMACGKTGTVALRAVGGVMAAVDAVCNGTIVSAFCALRPPGHHAHNNVNNDGICKGEGFCFFNNVAVAARYAQAAWHLKNVLIIDWDYHHGNGTEDAFYRDPTVFYFSTHRLPAYPGTGYPMRRGEAEGAGYNCNVPLPCPEKPYGTVTDTELIAAFSDHLIPSLSAVNFRPDMVLISAGFDSRTNDTLGDFSITDDGFYRMTRLVADFAKETCGGKIVSTLEGGYNAEGLASAGFAHIKALTECSATPAVPSMR
jgi:acetoin utilization deacetylase AcuC-like enzyme